MTTPKIERGTAKLADLKPAPYNPRAISPEALAGLRASVERFGLVQDVVVNRRTGHVVGGHQRLEVLRAAGVEDVPVTWVDLPDVEEKALNVTLNNPAINGGFTDDLGPLLEEIKINLPMDFECMNLDELARTEKVSLSPDPDADDVPVVQPDAVSKRGEVYELGPHRLMCGDATDAIDWATLGVDRDGCVAFWSPPYAMGKNAKLSGNSAAARRGSLYVNDNDSDGQWLVTTTSMVMNALRFASCAVVNLQPLAGCKRDLFRLIANHDDVLCDVVVWDKGRAAPQMSPGVLSSEYEMLVVMGDVGSSRRIPLSSWRGNVGSVYHAPPNTGNEYSDIHGACFPVHLPEFVIGRLCNLSRSVVDLCMGTGTTLIAAARTRRVSYGMEIEPRYCDVTRRRWTRWAREHAQDPGPGALD